MSRIAAHAMLVVLLAIMALLAVHFGLAEYRTIPQVAELPELP